MACQNNLCGDRIEFRGGKCRGGKCRPPRHFPPSGESPYDIFYKYIYMVGF